MAQVFISYKHTMASTRFVNRLCGYLSDAGFETWVDAKRLRGGDDWRDEIDQAIRESLALIVVLTPEAITSQYVTYEWAFALGVGVPVIPILYRPIEKLHPRLEGKHYRDFSVRNRYPWKDVIADLRAIEKQQTAINSNPSSTTRTDHPLLVDLTSVEIEVGALWSLYGRVSDFVWDGLNIHMRNGARIGPLSSVPYDDARYEMLAPDMIPYTVYGLAIYEMSPGTIFGMITAEDHCAVLRVDDVKLRGPLTISYRVYDGTR